MKTHELERLLRTNKDLLKKSIPLKTRIKAKLIKHERFILGVILGIAFWIFINWFCDAMWAIWLRGNQ